MFLALFCGDIHALCTFKRVGYRFSINGVFCAFLQVGIVNAWMVSFIMLREFIVTGLRLYGLNKGVILEAKRFGKHKTFSQVLGFVVIFITLILRKVFPANNSVVFWLEIV